MVVVCRLFHNANVLSAKKNICGMVGLLAAERALRHLLRRRQQNKQQI
jgi:hypothetical protein